VPDTLVWHVELQNGINVELWCVAGIPVLTWSRPGASTEIRVHTGVAWRDVELQCAGMTDLVVKLIQPYRLPAEIDPNEVLK